VTAKGRRVLDQHRKAAHPFMSVMYGAVLDSTSAVDPRTVEIKLKAPFQGLLLRAVVVADADPAGARLRHRADPEASGQREARRVGPVQVRRMEAARVT
jgi:hypothetical protein